MNFKKYIRPGKNASDVTPLLGNAQAFHAVVDELVKSFRNKELQKIACVEGRGFIFGSAVAYALNLGLIPLRYPGKLKNDVFSEKFIDYSKKEKVLEIHQDAIEKGEKVLIIDDWIETGATIKAAIGLIERCGGEIVGVGAFIDDSNDDLKNYLLKYNYKFLEKVEETDTF